MTVVLVALIATLLIQIGYFLWKIAAVSLPPIGRSSFSRVVSGLFSSWQWVLGLFATIAGWLFFIKATDIGEVSLVQPLMSIGDLFLVLLAVVFLNERLTKIECLGLGLTVIGAISIASEAEIVKPVTVSWFALSVFFALILPCLFCLLMVSKRLSRPEVVLAIAVGVGFGAGSILTKLMTAYIAFSGQQLELSVVLFNPVFPFMVAANVAGLVLLQIAFQQGRAAVIIPVQLSVVNLLAVIAGKVIFLEAISVLRFSGIAFIVVGTIFLHQSGRGVKNINV